GRGPQRLPPRATGRGPASAGLLARRGLIEMLTSSTLAEWVTDAGQRTLALVADLRDDQLLGPRLDIVNPLLWEIGHLPWFYDKWVLRHGTGRPAARADAEALYDSSAVPHPTRS